MRRVVRLERLAEEVEGVGVAVRRIGACAVLSSLLGRNIDHGRRKPRGQIDEIGQGLRLVRGPRSIAPKLAGARRR